MSRSVARQCLLVVGCGPSVPDITIHKAVKTGNITAVKQHLAAGTDVNTNDEDGETPLYRAAYHGYKEIAKLLIADTDLGVHKLLVGRISALVKLWHQVAPN